MSPREMFYKNVSPTLGHRLPFRFRVVAFIPKEHRELIGLDERGDDCILVVLMKRPFVAY